jgi:hypothetical protein
VDNLVDNPNLVDSRNKKTKKSDPQNIVPILEKNSPFFAPFVHHLDQHLKKISILYGSNISGWWLTYPYG